MADPLPPLITVPGERRAWVPVAGAILADIDAGKLRPGDRIPVQAELAARCGVAVETAGRALTELVHAGVITRRGTSTGPYYVAADQGVPDPGEPGGEKERPR